MTTFPEINALSLKEVSEALRMAYNTVDSLTDAGQVALRARIEHLEDRKRRLEATGDSIAASFAHEIAVGKMRDSSTPAASKALGKVIKSASEAQADAELKAFERAQYAQRLWMTAARNLELACGLDWDDLTSYDLDNITLENLKAKGVRP